MRSRAGYWIGGGLVAVGVVGAVLWFVLSLLSLGDEIDGFQRVSVPGDATVQFEAGKHVIYYEGPNADAVAPAVGLVIEDPLSGARLPIERYESMLTYSMSGYAGSAQATFESPRSGPFVVHTVGDPGPGEWNVAFGSSIAWPFVRSFLGAFLIGGALGLAGAILVVVTAIRRSRAGRAPVAPLEPGAAGNTGPLGRRRGVGFGILMYILTFGIYSLYWVFQTQEETKRHTGEGLGGVVGLVVWLVISPVSAFVIPSEIGAMYRSAGQEPPLTGWAGLWLFPGALLIVPAIVWFVLVQQALNRYWEAADRVLV